jgi:hypothetical protein
MEWKDIKSNGSQHYKSGSVEPLDLLKEGGILRDKAIGDIIKYAYRNRREVRRRINISDMNKIIHYAQILIVMEEEKNAKSKAT